VIVGLWGSEEIGAVTGRAGIGAELWTNFASQIAAAEAEGNS
jgi:hypothetical protein